MPEHPQETAPRPSPGTDPTNPFHQEATGEWIPAERAAERHNDEVGLTDRDRQERDPSV
jgi:hypothetical protein